MNTNDQQKRIEQLQSEIYDLQKEIDDIKSMPAQWEPKTVYGGYYITLSHRVSEVEGVMCNTSGNTYRSQIMCQRDAELNRIRSILSSYVRSETKKGEYCICFRTVSGKWVKADGDDISDTPLLCSKYCAEELCDLLNTEYQDGESMIKGVPVNVSEHFKKLGLD